MEQRLFFFLLRRWCLKREDSISLPNGVVCLLPSLPYDVQVKSNTTLRKSAKKKKTPTKANQESKELESKEEA